MKQVLLIVLCSIAFCIGTFAQSSKRQTSPDLAFFDLNGKVKSFTWGNLRYTYDTKGKLLTVNGRKAVLTSTRMIKDPDDFYFMRDKAGNIGTINAWEWGETYKWANGRIVSNDGYNENVISKTTYKYDSKGHLIQLTTKSWEEENENKITTDVTEYKYLKFDKMGNWIKRTCNGEIQERKIFYYK